MIVHSRRWKHLRRAILLGLSAIAALLLHGSASALDSHYAITGKAPFNQLNYYPIVQTLPASLYRPTGNWVGRLILPTAPQGKAQSDWVWIEVYHAPAEAANLIGKTVQLAWSQDADIQQYVKSVTRDVKFAPDVEQSKQNGNLHPDRLNQQTAIGPLHSIAGARPKDDVVVTLDAAIVTRSSDGSPKLEIKTEPVLETSRYYALVKILAPVAQPNPPKDCPGTAPCSSELFRVQHYNSATREFDGVQETIRIPQQPRDGFGVFASTPRDLQKSAAGSAGWYVYGAQDQTGRFTVQALKPRSLFQLTPQQLVLNESAGLDYIHYEHWKNTKERKGTVQTVLIDPSANTADAAIAAWKEGDRALVMHLFGGRGGKNGEAPTFGTVTGHFAYGLATVVREPLANELQFNLRYQQVYATNIEGVIAGTNAWTNYMGNLQRGWLGTRPVSDVLVKLDAIAQDYDFGGNPLSPLDALTRQLQIISARYRIGDGTGAAIVTPATSCVQDSNQALFLTIGRIRRSVEASPAIQSWWSSHPNDPTVKRFEQLIALGDDLEKQLAPFGIVRADWESNADALSGTRRSFVQANDGVQNIVSALISWRTILPRQAQDELSALFLRHGAKLWVLKTNQVGGLDPDIFPIAPTQAFGSWTLPGTTIPIVSVLFVRVLGSLTLPTLSEWVMFFGISAVYSAIAVSIGLSQGFLQPQLWQASPLQYGLLALRLLLLPALFEEFVFRVLLLPYPGAGATWQAWTIWAILSLGLFVVYHPFNAKTFYKSGFPTFFDPVFLTLTGLLGLACTAIYRLSGSLLLIVLAHWIAVFVWLVLFGGLKKLQVPEQRSSPSP